MNRSKLCFAVPGADSIIDFCHVVTHRGAYSGDTLEDVQRRHPGAEILELDAFFAAKAARQAAEPRTWTEIGEETYFEKLEVLPPAAMLGGAFLLGEASDSHASGAPRFRAYKREGGKHYALSVPIMISEFRKMFGAA